MVKTKKHFMWVLQVRGGGCLCESSVPMKGGPGDSLSAIEWHPVRAYQINLIRINQADLIFLNQNAQQNQSLRKLYLLSIFLFISVIRAFLCCVLLSKISQ
jgi:hypothetical protein